jgi:hypothetical protein
MIIQRNIQESALCLEQLPLGRWATLINGRTILKDEVTAQDLVAGYGTVAKGLESILKDLNLNWVNIEIRKSNGSAHIKEDGWLMLRSEATPMAGAMSVVPPSKVEDTGSVSYHKLSADQAEMMTQFWKNQYQEEHQRCKEWIKKYDQSHDDSIELKHQIASMEGAKQTAVTLAKLESEQSLSGVLSKVLEPANIASIASIFKAGQGGGGAGAGAGYNMLSGFDPKYASAVGSMVDSMASLSEAHLGKLLDIAHSLIAKPTQIDIAYSTMQERSQQN